MTCLRDWCYPMQLRHQSRRRTRTISFASTAAVLIAFLPLPKPHHHIRHHPLGRHYTVSSTCYAQGGATATPHVDAYFGEVAVLLGFLPLHTRIRLDRPAFGRRDFVVLDHIGEGSELDIFFPSESACESYGRQQRGFRIVP